MVFEPTNSNDHDDRCCCPVCSGLCQDDYEYYSNTGQYVELNISRRMRIKNRLYRIRLRIKNCGNCIWRCATNWIAEHSFGLIKHYWFY